MTTLKENYHQNMTLDEAEKLVFQTLKQVMEERISTENLEVCVIRTSTIKLEYRSPEIIQNMLNQLN